MGGPKEAQRFVDKWSHRLWGFALGLAIPVVGAAFVGWVFPAEASRDRTSDLEFVYPYDI
ncbi:MAG: hypothetical protein AAGP08_04985 [Pseudomonadota bacterium]